MHLTQDIANLGPDSSWHMSSAEEEVEALGIIFRRTAQKLTQEELAHRAEMDVIYLSDLERGKWNPSLAMLADLARALSDLLKNLKTGAEGAPLRRKRPKL